MKIYIVIIFIFTFSISLTKAQGNLQFNTVVNFAFTRTMNSDLYLDTTITIPVNRVWKVESFMTGYSTDTTSYYSNINSGGGTMMIILNGTGLSPNNSDGNGNGAIWLTLETVNKIGIRKFLSYPATNKFFITAIEYNIVP